MVIGYCITYFFLDFFERLVVHRGPVKWFILLHALNGADNDAKFGMNLFNWLIDPISDLMSLMQPGSFKFLIASDLCNNGVVPFPSISNPSLLDCGSETYSFPILWPILHRLMFLKH